MFLRQVKPMHAVSFCSSKGFGGQARTRFFGQPWYDSATPWLGGLLEASEWQFRSFSQSIEALRPSHLI